MLGKQMRGKKETVKTFFFLEWKVKIMEVLTLVTVRSQQQQKKESKRKQKQKQKNKTQKQRRKHTLLKNRKQAETFLCSSLCSVVFLSGAKWELYKVHETSS